MVVLDTDYMSILERDQKPFAQIIRNRLSELGISQCATTIISYEEQMRGWLSFLAKAKTMANQVVAYRKLKQQMVNYSTTLILDFDENAAVEFQTLKRAKIRLGTMDLKIAAIARSMGGTVLTRNISDFQLVPGLKVADWTKE